MAEDLAPDAILASVDYTGTVADIDDDPDNPDTAWLTWNGNEAPSVRVSFPTPSGALDGTQTFKAWLRDTALDDQVVDLELYEAGTFVKTVVNDAAVDSTSGAIVSGTWSAADVTDGADVELRVAATVSRSESVEVGAVEWVATVKVAGEAHLDSPAGLASGTAAVEISGTAGLDSPATLLAGTVDVEKVGEGHFDSPAAQMAAAAAVEVSAAAGLDSPAGLLSAAGTAVVLSGEQIVAVQGVFDDQLAVAGDYSPAVAVTQQVGTYSDTYSDTYEADPVGPQAEYRPAYRVQGAT